MTHPRPADLDGHDSDAQRWSLVLGLVVAAIVLAAVGARWHQLRSEARAEWKEQLGSLAEVTRATIELWHREREGEVERTSKALGEGLRLLDVSGPSDLAAQLALAMVTPTTHVAAWLVGADDAVIARDGEELPLSANLLDLIERARDRDTVLELPFLLGDSAVLVAFAAPLPHPRGAVLVQAADPRPTINALLERHPRLVGSEEYRAVTQVGDHVVVLSPDTEPGLWVRLAAEAAPSTRLAVLNQDTFAQFSQRSGGEMLAAVRPMGRGSWGVVGRVPVADAMAAADRQALLEGLGLTAVGGLVVLGVLSRRRRAQLRLLQMKEAEEERYRTVVSHASDGIFLADEELRLIDLNPAALRALGVEPDAVIGTSFLDLFPPGAREASTLRLEALRAGKTVVRERQLLRSDGTTFDAEMAAQLLPDGRFLAVVRDLTDRRAAQAAVEHSLSLLQTTLDSTSDGILVVDREGRLSAFNSRFAELWGVPESVLRQGDDETAMTYVLPQLADPTQFMERVKELVAQPEAESRDVITFKDGRVVERVSGPQRLGDEIIGRVWTFHDLTEEAEAAETLRESEERYRGLFDHAVFGVYRSTAMGRFLAVNPALVQMLGYDSPDELLSMTSIAESIYADPEERTRLITDHAGTGRIDGVTTQWRRRDGTLIHVRLSGRPVTAADGTLRGFEMFAEDVTERRLLEEQLRQAQKMEAVGQLTGGIAHDFNNLLTAILAGAELLAFDERGGDGSEEVRTIREAALKGGALVRKLMAVSRSDPLDLSVLDPAVLVRDMQALLQRLLPATIRVVAESDPGVGMIRADRGALEQIILNLATNARDALPDGGTLSMSLASIDMTGGSEGRLGTYVRLTVRDTGAGMDERTRLRIFEPFFTTKEPGRGTGLGMAMVYGLVKQHLGFVDVESTPGAGTRVHVYLPRVRPPVDSDDEAPEVDLPRGDETILLVEDDEIVRRTTPRILERFGYTVLVAADGLEALEILRACPTIDLVVTDLVMPRMGGQALYEAAKALPTTPRFLFSSGHIKDDVGIGVSLDPEVPFLRKPWSLSTLLQRVREALDE